MLDVFKHSWALLLGMLLLMLGNGLQGSLLGVRGSGEGFSAFSMSVVMSSGAAAKSFLEGAFGTGPIHRLRFDTYRMNVFFLL